MRVLCALLSAVALGSALECGNVISMEQAINYAKQYVGTVQSSQLSQNRKTKECYYRIRGTEGTALIDARDGKLLRFYRKR